MYKRLLVPIDGSAHSARALPLAAAIAVRAGASLQVAVVHDPSAYIPFVPGEVAIPVYDRELVAQHRAEDQRVVDAAVASLTAQGVSASGVLLDGTIVEALEAQVVRAGIDAVIMTTHGRSGFDRLRMGSVATAFLTRATVPILLVRAPDGAPETPPSLPTGALLCPLDGSPFAEAILPYATAFAGLLGLRLHLIDVTVPHALPMAPFGAEALLADDSALRAEEQGRASYLSRVLATCPAGSSIEAVTDMSVARAILEASKKTGVGAIAMATHGRGGFKRLVLGSVADEVIRHASVPLLVYRPPAS